jgi:hypothetical protein
MMTEWAASEAEVYANGLSEAVANPGFVRFVSLDEWPAVMARCVERRGGAGASYGPGYSASLPSRVSAGAASTYRADAQCHIEYPLIALRSRLRTDDQLRYIHAYFAAWLIPCLRSSGLSVGPLPAVKTFVMQSANGVRMWSPYSHVSSEPDQTDASAAALAARCPPLPPGIPAAGGDDGGVP